MRINTNQIPTGMLFSSPFSQQNAGLLRWTCILILHTCLFCIHEAQTKCRPVGRHFEACVKSALAELRRTTGGFEAVLFVVCRLKPLKTQAFFALTSKITSIVTSKWGYFLKTQARYGTFGMVMLVCIK